MIDMVQRMGVPLLMMSGVEADDIIGTVARRSVESGLHVSIVSPDKAGPVCLCTKHKKIPSTKGFTKLK